MFTSNLVSKICLPKFNHGDHALSLIYSRCLQKQTRTARFSSFQCKAIANHKPFKQLSVNRLHNTDFMFRCHSVQASFVAKSENDKQIKTSFQELMFARKEQAHRSVLIHVSTKNSIPYALAKCEQFGNIANAYSYAGENSNYFMLIEFSSEASTQDLFKSCQYEYATDILPVFSRIIQFEKKSSTIFLKVNTEVQECNNIESSQKIGRSVSKVIQDVYSDEKLTELDTRLRYFFCELLKDAASTIFPYCEAFPFGSSVNGIGKRGCDLDIMIRLHPDHNMLTKLESKQQNDGEFTFLNKTCVGQKTLQQKVVNVLGDYFRTFLPGITSMQKILHARVPIMKMNHRLLKMDCDVSVNNMSAIFMSDVVHFCGEVDSRFRPLLYAIKKWAREAEITRSAPGSWITNFGLTSLLIFFFQKELIFPSFKDAFNIIGEENSPNFCLQYLKSVDECKNLASQNEKPLAELLIDFFSFLAEFEFEKNILSLMSGEARTHSQHGITMWVQYPFDEDLNVTKNLSQYEYSDLCSKAGIAAKSIESKLSQRVNCSPNFSVLFGIPHCKKVKKVVDVNAYFEKDNPKQRSVRQRRL